MKEGVILNMKMASDYILTIDRLIRNNYVKFARISKKWNEYVDIMKKEADIMSIEEVRTNLSEFIFSICDPHFVLYTNRVEEAFFGLSLIDEELWCQFSPEESEKKLISINNQTVADIFAGLFHRGICSSLLRYRFFMKENINGKDEIEAMYLENGIKVNRTIRKIKMNTLIDKPDMKKFAGLKKLKITSHEEVTIVKVPTFSDVALLSEMELQEETLSESDILIIDLRMNTGGIVDTAKEFVSYFINQETELFYLTDQITSSMTTAKCVNVAPKSTSLCGNIFVIQNEYTASASEYIVINALLKNGAVTIGSKTAGFSNQASLYILEDHSRLEITSKLFVDSDGKEFMPTGFEPTLFYPMITKASDEDIVKYVRAYRKTMNERIQAPV